MIDLRKITGFKGEEIAASFLKERGFDILERNWRCRLGEIDIVVRKDGKLVFCEAKTKKNDKFGLPEEMISKQKQQKLKQLALLYLKENYGQIMPYQIDVLAVDIEKGEVRHIENAVEE
jgi:putative endonuclease